MNAKIISVALLLALPQLVRAGEMVVHDAVMVNDGSTRLVNCQNTRGLLVLVRPIAAADAFIVNADVQNSSLSDALARVLPSGWSVRYS